MPPGFPPEAPASFPEGPMSSSATITPTAPHLAPGQAAPSDDPLGPLRAAVEHAAHLLPAQGPITVFIHHNTLHAFEAMPFDQAVQAGGRTFGCAPYLDEDRYREALERGRIRFDDLRAVLADELADQAAPGLTPEARLEVRLALLQYPIRSGSAAELLWFIEETDALQRVRPDVSAATRGRLLSETRRWALRDLRAASAAVRPAWVGPLFARHREAAIEDWPPATWEAFTLQALWHVVRAGVAGVPDGGPPPPPPLRHRDLLLAVDGTDTDALVHPLLIRFCSAFLDQGQAQRPLPGREGGFFAAFAALYGQPAGPPDAWLAGLRGELARYDREGLAPIEVVRDNLRLLGVAPADWEAYVAAALLALRGWAGMVRQVEERGDRVAVPIPDGSLVEFLAVRLLLDRLALAHAARADFGYAGPPAGLRTFLLRRWHPPARPTLEQRAFPLFQLAQIIGWAPEDLARYRPAQWEALLREVEAFSGVERRRVFHLAYERRFREQTLDALALGGGAATPATPRFQAMFCLDEREESLRRHLEEVAPDAETFGAAGFYGVAMYYRGAADAYFVPLCPVVIRPGHWVEECVDAAHEGEHRRAAATRRVVGRATHGFHHGSRGVVLGALLTATIGLLASIPLVLRVLFPRVSARLRRYFGRFVDRSPKTRLLLNREEGETPGPENGRRGYTLTERVNIGERLLRDVGLTRNFARLVLILGHGSNSRNNPHKSAYDCGACGGSVGGPNGRALAAILNEPAVRAGLAERGVAIPEATRFVGGWHNTCDDAVAFLDLDAVPASHLEEFERAAADLAAACRRNAHERSRRFRSAPLTLSAEAAKVHVEERSEDLAQTRPELGHATNALCVVGRRSRTRGLFLDRRAFLTSYDPTQDDAESAVLARILAAVFPVCGGINLEYYFSHVDPAGYGAGTKLPHNITGLVGVMDGAASDLRTGLPWQMVEIHEPVRLLIVVESTPEALLGILARNPEADRLVRNGWVQLATLDPYSSAIQVFDKGAFRPYTPRQDSLPTAASSADWYRGWREHLEFARIGSAHD